MCYVGDSDVIFLFATFPLGVEFVQRKSCVIIRPLFFEGGKALSELWVFIVGPFIGAAVAAALWKLVETEK